MQVLHRRNDGTFVIELNGYPYHVTTDDPLFAEVSAAAEGLTLPPEPVPQSVDLPVPAQPPIAGLLARLQQLEAQVEALSKGAA